MTAGAPGRVDDDWLRPVGRVDADEAGWTRLGTLDGTGEPIVDRRGFVQVAPGLPGISWWVAGDDRWYFPERERTVRQSLSHNTPVVETRMRIKGGDVCLRTYAASVSAAGGAADGGFCEVVVAEFENTSGVPCGVAFGVRPFGVLDDVPVSMVAIDGGTVTADGSPVLVLPRPPAGCCAGEGVGGDLAERVVRGEATGASFAPVSCAHGRAQAVVVVPVAHRTTFRVVLPVPDVDGRFAAGADTFPGAVPPADNVARGWHTQVRELTRVAVADPRLHAVLEAAPGWLSATTNHALAPVGRTRWDAERTPRWREVAATAGALDRLGATDRSAVLLARAAAAHLADPVAAPADGATWLVEAFAGHVARTGDAAFAAAVAEAVELVLTSLGSARRPSGDPARRGAVFAAAAEVFTAAGQSRAAAASRKAARKADAGPGSATSVAPTGASPDLLAEALTARAALEAGDGAAAWAFLDRALDEVTSTGVWAAHGPRGVEGHSVGVTGAVVALACDLLAVADDDRLRLVAHMPTSWVGRQFNVERLITPVGSVGYAVRWHGDRPALLWELTPRPGVEVGDEIVVTAPGLDASWQGRGLAGEALLGAVEAAAVPAKPGARISGLQIGPSRGGA